MQYLSPEYPLPNDPDVVEILGKLSQPIYKLRDLDGQPYRIAKLQEEVAAGRLKADYCGRFRVVSAIARAQWLALLLREGKRSALDSERAKKLANERHTKRRESLATA
jgi:hypothetical protein